MTARASSNMDRYSKEARKLPVPSEDQTREFAEYVTSAHSWYKHLPLNPPVPFVFYLDQNSGRSMLHVSDDEVAFVDNVDEKEAFHYTWQKTALYRQRFGHWNYHAPYGKSFQVQRNEGVVDTAGTGLMTFFDSAGWLEVPKRLALAGTALLSALMWVMYGSKGAPRADFDNSFMMPPMALGDELVRHAAPSSLLPAEIADAARKLEALWDSEGYRREKLETYRAANDRSDRIRAECKATNRTWNEVEDPEASARMYRETEVAWERTASRRKERVLMAPALEAIERERQRQIASMIAAMNQFVEILHRDR